MISHNPKIWEIEKAYRAVDELKITRALSITVSSSVLGTSQVTRVLCHSTISIHLREVESTVQSARKLGDIHSESEFLSQKVEGLVLSGASRCHQVCSRSDVGSCTLGNKVESESITRGGDTIDAGVVCTIKSAVGGTSCVVWAESCVPGVAIVAVGSATSSLMEPSPVGIEDDGLSRGCAAACGTLADSQSRVGLSSDNSNLLGLSRNEEGSEGEDTR